MVIKEKLIDKLYLVSIAVFCVSLTQKAFCTTDCADSFLILIFGWSAVFMNFVGISWYANVFLIFSWFYRNHLSRAIKFSLIALILSLSFLFFDGIIDNEAGKIRKIQTYNLGYWIWVTSIFIMFIRNLILLKNKAQS